MIDRFLKEAVWEDDSCIRLDCVHGTMGSDNEFFSYYLVMLLIVVLMLYVAHMLYASDFVLLVTGTVSDNRAGIYRLHGQIT